MLDIFIEKVLHVKFLLFNLILLFKFKSLYNLHMLPNFLELLQLDYGFV